MTATDAGADEVPYYLMPVAATLGMYAAGASIRALYQIYRNATHDKSKVTATDRLRGNLPKPLKSRQFSFLIISIAASVLAYGYVSAQVDNALAASDFFDPYEILNVTTGATIDEIKASYRSLSKEAHPDKGGDADLFLRINLSYRALTDASSRVNFEKYGHPDGPQSRTLSFAMPAWLLQPSGNVALVLVILYLGAFVGLIIWVLRSLTRTQGAQARNFSENSVAGADAKYLANHLGPTSSHLEVLLCIATSPESLQIAQTEVEKAEKVRSERIAFLGKKDREVKSGSGSNADREFDLDAGGWADDEEEDEETKRRAEMARTEDEAKKKAAAQLAAATGKNATPEHTLLEGIDDGVLGQKWVESTLEKAGQWPPQLGSFEKATFPNKKGRLAGVLENPAARRNICMTMGRLNSMMLNTHPELLKAGQKRLVDRTYFQSNMEFRQRTALLLEAALRLAISAKSYRLAKTIIEAVAMFKIGTMSHEDKETLKWFKDTMKKQYNGDDGIPRLEVKGENIETPDEDEIATGDACALTLDIVRPHAENFTKQKLAVCQKQGIPPEVALQTYREGWWILIRAKREGGGEAEDALGSSDNPLLRILDEKTKKRYAAEAPENSLACAWPFIVSNVAQKEGKVKVQFKAPSLPGKYKFFVSIKSQEFLGADQDIVIAKEVLDREVLERMEMEEGDEEDSDDNESKKTK